MNWKATTLVWGTGLLATWYASVPPVQTPPAAAQPAAAGATAVDPAAVSDIEEQAARLQGQLRRQADYVPPARNLFRFTARAAAPRVLQLPAPPPLDAPPLVMLAGIARDGEGDAAVRTAVLSTADGAVLAKEGDEVAGRYRLARIGDESVELTDLTTGSTIRLAFTP